MQRTLYTIGHSKHPIEEFAELLRQNGVEYLIDVRSTPYSQFVPEYNRDVLGEAIKAYEIKYAYMGDAFGARQDKEELYSEEGYVDFDKVRKSRPFQKGMERVMNGLQQGFSLALMCTEKDPIDCHRAIMVTKAFSDLGVDVEHILEQGQLESQKALESRLLDMYFPKRDQLSFFSTSSDERATIEDAYRMRNREIGYRKDERGEKPRIARSLRRVAVF